MAAGHEKCHKGKGWRVRFQERREEVPFHVMNRQGGNAQGEGQTATKGGPHQQGAHKPGPGGIGHAIEIVELPAGLGQHAFEERQKTTAVVPAGELRHHAAIGGVEVNLAMERVGDESAFRIEERETRLVAGAFDAKHAHERIYPRKKAAC